MFQDHGQSLKMSFREPRVRRHHRNKNTNPARIGHKSHGNGHHPATNGCSIERFVRRFEHLLVSCIRCQDLLRHARESEDRAKVKIKTRHDADGIGHVPKRSMLRLKFDGRFRREG